MRRLVTADRMWATGTVGGNGALPAPQSPQQTLFAVLETRYGHTEVATVAGEGLLMTLAAANDDEQLLLQLVRSVLCGDRDAAYLRYFSRVRGLLRTVSAEQAGELLQDLYPDLPPDKLDELLLELTSLVGSAAVTPKAVEDFVLRVSSEGAYVTKGATVTVHATGTVQKPRKQFWSTKDKGQQPFTSAPPP